MKTLYVNPPGGVNANLPNMALAYAATLEPGLVVDLNTVPEPADRYLEHEADRLILSVRKLTWSQSEQVAQAYKEKYPEAKVLSLQGLVDVQCCYRFVPFGQTMVLPQVFGDELPFPDYERFDSFEYYLDRWRSGRWPYAIMTSLGCPFSCRYCESRKRTWLKRSAQHAVAEIANAKERWGIKSFVIIDDCFNVSKSRLLEFCDLVAPLNLSWFCSNGLRADLFDHQVAQALHRGGCSGVAFGIEAVDPEILAGVEKGETIDQVSQAVAIANDQWGRVGGFFIIGLPGSTFVTDFKSLMYCHSHRVNGLFSYHVGQTEDDKKDRSFYGPNSRPSPDSYSPFAQRSIYWLSKVQKIENRLRQALSKRTKSGA